MGANFSIKDANSNQRCGIRQRRWFARASPVGAGDIVRFLTRHASPSSIEGTAGTDQPSPGTMMYRTSLSRPTVSLEESMYRMFAHRALGAALSLILVSASATPSIAGVCFTSGKVYVQQKVW